MVLTTAFGEARVDVCPGVGVVNRAVSIVGDVACGAKCVAGTRAVEIPESVITSNSDLTKQRTRS